MIFEHAARVFQALSDKTRFKLYRYILREAQFCDLSQTKAIGNNYLNKIKSHFPLAHSTLSHHLTMLKNAKLVSEIRHGKKKFYFPIISTLDDLQLYLSEFATLAKAASDFDTAVINISKLADKSSIWQVIADLKRDPLYTAHEVVKSHIYDINLKADLETKIRLTITSQTITIHGDNGLVMDLNKMLLNFPIQVKL